MGVQQMAAVPRNAGGTLVLALFHQNLVLLRLVGELPIKIPGTPAIGAEDEIASVGVLPDQGRQLNVTDMTRVCRRCKGNSTCMSARQKSNPALRARSSRSSCMAMACRGRGAERMAAHDTFRQSSVHVRRTTRLCRPAQHSQPRMRLTGGASGATTCTLDSPLVSGLPVPDPKFVRRC